MLRSLAYWMIEGSQEYFRIVEIIFIIQQRFRLSMKKKAITIA
jgi:hypothetical protein